MIKSQKSKTKRKKMLGQYGNQDFELLYMCKYIVVNSVLPTKQGPHKGSHFFPESPFQERATLHFLVSLL